MQQISKFRAGAAHANTANAILTKDIFPQNYSKEGLLKTAAWYVNGASVLLANPILKRRADYEEMAAYLKIARNCYDEIAFFEGAKSHRLKHNQYEKLANMVNHSVEEIIMGSEAVKALELVAEDINNLKEKIKAMQLKPVKR